MSLATDRAAPTQPPSSPPLRPRKRRLPLIPWLMLSASILVLGVLTGYPVVRMLIMSFQEYERAQVMGTPPEWIWFENYTTILTDPTFWTVLARSIAFMIVAVTITMVVGTLLALLMMRLGKKMRLLVATGLLLAWAVPPISSTTVWGWIFDTQYGLVNNLLTRITGERWFGHSWLLDPLGFFTILTFIIVWGAIPFVAFTMYAGLSQIPSEVIEASQLDGAGPFQRFRLILLPYVRSIVTVLIVLSMIWDLKVFPQVYALQDIGGDRAKTNTIGVYIYQLGMGQGHFGPASAIAFIFVGVMLLLSIYYVRRTVKEEEL